MKDLDYLPRCLPCATGGKRVVYVRGYWRDARWRPDTLPDGSTPAYRRCQHGKYAPGVIINGIFYAKGGT